jgi:hypothetical protein
MQRSVQFKDIFERLLDIGEKQELGCRTENEDQATRRVEI